DAVQTTVGQTMLTESIRDSYDAGLVRLQEAGAETIAQGSPGGGPNAPAATVFRTNVENFIIETSLHEEVFGASTLIVTYKNSDDLLDAFASLGGQLTTTLQIADDGKDHSFASALLPHLELLAGRIIINGWPTGVEVVDSMVHGGPFPATSDSRATSV